MSISSIKIFHKQRSCTFNFILTIKSHNGDQLINQRSSSYQPPLFNHLKWAIEGIGLLPHHKILIGISDSIHESRGSVLEQAKIPTSLSSVSAHNTSIYPYNSITPVYITIFKEYIIYLKSKGVYKYMAESSHCSSLLLVLFIVQHSGYLILLSMATAP